MRKGCLTPLLIWGAATAVYWIVLQAQLRSPLDRNAAIAAGLGMWVAVELFRAGRRWLARAGEIGSPAGLHERPKEGETVTILGRIRAEGRLLRAPFSGQPALLYSCDVIDPRSEHSKRNRMSVYSGVALTPSVVDTPAGTIRLLGFPLGTQSEAVAIDGEAVRANAARWIASTPFTDFSAFQPKAMFEEMKDLVTDDDGQVQKAWRTRTLSDLDGMKLTEFAIGPGEEVCVIGRYSAERNGIVPDPSNPIQMFRGNAQTVARSLRMKGLGNIAAAGVLAVVVNVALYVFVRVNG